MKKEQIKQSIKQYSIGRIGKIDIDSILEDSDYSSDREKVEGILKDSVKRMRKVFNGTRDIEKLKRRQNDILEDTVNKLNK